MLRELRGHDDASSSFRVEGAEYVPKQAVLADSPQTLSLVSNVHDPFAVTRRAPHRALAAAVIAAQPTLRNVPAHRAPMLFLAVASWTDLLSHVHTCQ